MAKREPGTRATEPKLPAERRGARDVREEHDQTWTAVPRLAGSSEKRAFLLVRSGPQLGEVFQLPSHR